MAALWEVAMGRSDYRLEAREAPLVACGGAAIESLCRNGLATWWSILLIVENLTIRTLPDSSQDTRGQMQSSAGRRIYRRSPLTVTEPFVPSRWVPSREGVSRSVYPWFQCMTTELFLQVHVAENGGAGAVPSGLMTTVG